MPVSNSRTDGRCGLSLDPAITSSWGTAQSQGQRVEWVPEARWVEDRNRWTSSGVAAGMDMALALIERLHGGDVALRLADMVEYDWHRDPAWDPFAAKNGLMP